MAEYKNYIFDLYGTLVDILTDEEKKALWENMARVYSMMGASYTFDELNSQYKKFVEEELAETFSKMQDGFGDKKIVCEDVEIQLIHVFERLFAEKGVKPGRGQLEQVGLVFRSLSTEYMKLFDGVMELIAQLKRAGKKIYILSNAQRMYTEPEMRMLGIYDCFDGILYSSDVGVKKPSYYFYEALFHRYGLKKEESVMTGNEFHADILGADAYGIHSMYVFTSQSGEEPDELPMGCRRLKHIGEVFDHSGS